MSGCRSDDEGAMDRLTMSCEVDEVDDGDDAVDDDVDHDHDVPLNHQQRMVE